MDYASQVADMAQRLEALKADEELQRAKGVVEGLEELSDVTNETNEKIEAIYEVYVAKLREVTDWYEMERAKLVGPAMEQAKAAVAVAQAALDKVSVGDFAVDEDGAIIKCALSGAPILESDYAIEFSGDWVLAHLVLPADYMERKAAEMEDEEEGEIFIEAA